MSKNKACLYARVSTELEQQQSSIKSQTDVDHDYFERNNYELVEIYADVGESATSTNRTNFLKMVKHAGIDYKRGDGQEMLFTINEQRKPLFDWIVVKDVSRFTRNVDSVNLMKKIVENNVHIDFVDSGFTTQFEDWHTRVTMYILFAQEEALNTSRKLRNAYHRRAKKGNFHMSVNLMGYDRERGTDEHYIVEDEAKIIREIYDYYTEKGIGSYEISNLLNEKGYKTRKGHRWAGNAVRRILNNEKYCGTVILNKHGIQDITGSARRIIKPKSEWIIHEGAIPKIVSVEQFEKAQEIMKNRTVYHAQQKDQTKHKEEEER